MYTTSIWQQPLVFIDLETTGVNAARERMIEIGPCEVRRHGLKAGRTGGRRLRDADLIYPGAMST